MIAHPRQKNIKKGGQSERSSFLQKGLLLTTSWVTGTERKQKQGGVPRAELFKIVI